MEEGETEKTNAGKVFYAVDTDFSFVFSSFGYRS